MIYYYITLYYSRWLIFYLPFRLTEFRNLLKAVEVADELVRKPPEFVLLASFVGRKCGLAGQELALAGIARAIGWIAHASEQCQQPVARQRADYVGKLPS